MDAMQLIGLGMVVVVVVLCVLASLSCLSQKENTQINNAALPGMQRIPKSHACNSRYDEATNWGAH